MNRLAAFVLGLALTGCALPNDVDPGTAVDLFVAEVEFWNASGVNVIEADDETRAYMALSCGSMRAAAALYRPDQVDTIDAFCRALLAVAK